MNPFTDSLSEILERNQRNLAAQTAAMSLKWDGPKPQGKSLALAQAIASYSPMNIHQYPTSESELPAYRVAVMSAALAGAVVEQSCPNIGCNDWLVIPDPSWCWSRIRYRIQPAPVTRKVALKSADYPPVFWLRVAPGKDFPGQNPFSRVPIMAPATEKLCTSFWHDRPRFGSYWLTEEQSLVCEYSVDRQTWKPCYRTETL